MLLNRYEDAADILQYIPVGRGHHKWIFIDTEKLPVPHGTLSVSLWYGSEATPESGAVKPEDITFFDDHVEVIGDEYVEYVRHPQWPDNVFVNREFLRENPAESNVERDNWIVNIYYYRPELAERVDVIDIARFARTSVPSVAIFPIDCQSSDSLPWDVSVNAGLAFASPDSGQDQAKRINTANSEDGTTLSRWIHFDETMDYTYLRTQRSGIVSFANRRYGDGDFNSSSYRHHIDDDEVASIPYFRRPWWPMGVFRLAELYYTDDANQAGPAYIPVFDDEPSPEECEAYEVAHTHESGQVLGHEYQKRYNLEHALLTGRGQEWRQHDHLTNPHRWVHLISDGEIKEAGEGQGSINIRVGDYAITSHHLRPHVEDVVGERFADGVSMYRYERWPHYVWSSIWNTDADGEKVPAYGPDAFGSTCPYDDNSTPDDPICDSGGFAYQKWIRPTWDPSAVSTGGSAFMSVGFREGHYESRVRYSHDPYHVNNWTESSQRFQATYFRRATFPAGLWRRADRFTDVHINGYDSLHMEILHHDDEPGCADAPAPWYSAYLENWVSEMGEKSGRPISSRVGGDSPWLKFWTPSESASHSGDYINARIGGHQVILPVGELPRVRGHSRGITILDDEGNYSIARKYRSGVALAFNPCGVRYADEAEEGVERPHPLKLILDQVEEFYAEYHDPDVVEDLVDDMFERVKTKVQGFNDIISREQSLVRTLHISLLKSAKKINEVLDKRSYYDSMSKGRFRHTLEANRGLVANLGSLRIDGDFLILRMHMFEIEEQPIGPLLISIDISGRELPLIVTTEDNESQHGNSHPHVDTDGRVCWGSGLDIAEQMAIGADPIEYMFWAANVLREGYRSNDSYCTIAQWIHKDTWWCEYCEDDHPNDTSCPCVCDRCEIHTNMDEHHSCGRHGCWDEDDSEGGDCPACEEEEAEERLEEEQEEERLEKERLAEEEAARLEEDVEEVRQRLATPGEAQPENQQSADEDSAAE